MPRLTRKNWLEHGLMQLAEHGVESLTIDALCTELGVTKGSFYHHFKHHRAYLEAVLQFWEEQYTKHFIESSLQGQNPQQQLERLHEIVIASYGTFEVNIRAWAQVDPLARDYQERVDQQRLDFLYQIQLRLYTKPEIAKTMAYLQYTALIGSAQIMPPLSSDDLRNMYALLTKLSIMMQQKDENR